MTGECKNISGKYPYLRYKERGAIRIVYVSRERERERERDRERERERERETTHLLQYRPYYGTNGHRQHIMDDSTKLAQTRDTPRVCTEIPHVHFH